ncbi:hypothetical protein [Deinococcus maricopensis]|uniref:Uncharacterized protein n=1 Tax=Deinococcus maricopensis (strain DSM 21211 / LMG 22137 / NRRL B-23946 / LB-34) TaxID=709986 RepID=E8UBM8_DEIML|nr:hypothetical protein [Deinococcus maricopensis]ADV68467.1 hypothetical protein Deima_2838 [Deinococcus maricopensis DSM 21211]
MRRIDPLPLALLLSALCSAALIVRYLLTGQLSPELFTISAGLTTTLATLHHQRTSAKPSILPAKKRP